MENCYLLLQTLESLKTTLLGSESDGWDISKSTSIASRGLAAQWIQAPLSVPHLCLIILSPVADLRRRDFNSVVKS